MSDFEDLVEDLKQKRDELRVQMNLASKEIQDEWEELEGKTRHFLAKAELAKTGEGVGDALGDLGQELKKGYQRIRDAIKD
ncbi:MAG: hypothetical protein QNJ00_06215 [Woeseiaceae bacterium]|nr:hypothetical protein [Woeseiaceae bacterium]MDJ0939339.1 hypothetical protein [Woeseiaceae bacterium]